MNSTLKTVVPSPGPPQNPPVVTAHLNKPMHPQGVPGTYGPPQSLVNAPHNSSSVDHGHPNPAHQSNHYSLNVPNASQHYSNSTQGTPTASNHPVANVSQSTHGQPTSDAQSYVTTKNVAHSGGYQQNQEPPPNQNPIPPVSQTLPATQTQATPHAPPPANPSAEKPQSNGTSETPAKSAVTEDSRVENHVLPPTKPPPTASAQPPPQGSTPAAAAPPATAVTATETPPAPLAAEQKPKPAAVPAAAPAQVEPSIPEARPPAPSSKPTSPAVKPAAPATKTASEPPSEKTNVPSASSSTTTTKPTAETAPTPEAESTLTDGQKAAPSEAKTADAAAQDTAGPVAEEKEQATPKQGPSPRVPARKSKASKPEDSPKSSKVTTTPQKSVSTPGKSKRARTKTQHYQSPLPEIEIITKISSSTPRPKNSDDKLIVFYKNEFLAVRNSEGGFYICQTMQNIYKHSPKIKIRWLSQDKNDKTGENYTPDFYDTTDFDCILTNLSLSRIDKGKFRLPPHEMERTNSILKRSIAVEKGEVTSPSLTEEHPDGIDLSLYKEESQLKKRTATKRKAVKSPAKTPKRERLQRTKRSDTAVKDDNDDDDDDGEEEEDDEEPPKKVAKKTPQKKDPAPTPAKKTPVTPAAEPKKPAPTSSRQDRALKRGVTPNKATPVVDQKKAKVLAKVARRTPAPPPSPPRSPSKGVTKTPKVAAPPPKTPKPQPPPKSPVVTNTKPKRSTRK